jgi:mannitol-1-phosphate 5-dehydrogenase
MAEHTFVGFGFGPIQSGLFVKEAFDSGNFGRIVVAEIDQRLVDAVRGQGGSYAVNVGGKTGIETEKIDGIEILNPAVAEDNASLREALAAATEIVTSLPSVNFYGSGGENSVASLIADGIANSKVPAKIIYTAENNNHAAETLREQVSDAGGIAGNNVSVQYLNTVIGKMSQVVTEAGEIDKLGLARMADGFDRSFLVEEFNRILVSKCTIDGFSPGIEVFDEKDDLLPFEEAKLYGHNAIHAMLAYIGSAKGLKKMTELSDYDDIMATARNAFIDESGGALIKKYSKLGEPLFTVDGYTSYADDLLERMTNPFLQDAVARAARDPMRKLSPNDRVFGTMNLAVEFGIEPVYMGVGALAGVLYVARGEGDFELPAGLAADKLGDLDDNKIRKILEFLWSGHSEQSAERLIGLTISANERLGGLLGGA